MDRVSGRLTVFFEDPFWVGVFERIENRKLSVAKVTFGAEPKDYEVLEFFNRNYYHLLFSPAVETVVKDTKKNPKRAQRDAKKQTLETGVGTKSQQALIFGRTGYDSICWIQSEFQTGHCVQAVGKLCIKAVYFERVCD